jgi:hypothetical protein
LFSPAEARDNLAKTQKPLLPAFANAIEKKPSP